MLHLAASVREQPAQPALITRLGIAIFFCIGMLFYMPFRSIQWDPNGLSEALGIQNGFLFHPNHLLYRPLGQLIFSFTHAIGLNLPLEIVLQYITAFSAAVSLCFLFAAYVHITKSPTAAALATLLLAVSWSYWSYSTDINYISLVVLATSAALLILSRSRLTWAGTISSGILCACSILFWQANIFVIPGLFFLLWQKSKHLTLPLRIKHAAAFLVATSLTVTVVYFFIGTAANPDKSFSTFIAWLFSYSTDTGGKPPIWGVWSITRIPLLLKSQLSSFIPVWEGLGLHQLITGVFQPDKLLGQLSLLSTIMLILLTMIRGWKHRSTAPSAWVIWALAAYACYLPFILWWDPFEPKWFILPNIFLLFGFAAIHQHDLTQKTIFPIVLGICIIAAANFQMTISPRHSKPNPRIALAQCFANQVNHQDGVVIHLWGWVDYAEYFSHYNGKVVYLKREIENQHINRLLIRRNLDELSLSGGKLYVPAWTNAEASYLQCVQGIDLVKIFADFDLRHAFTCGQQQFFRIAPD